MKHLPHDPEDAIENLAIVNRGLSYLLGEADQGGVVSLLPIVYR